MAKRKKVDTAAVMRDPRMRAQLKSMDRTIKTFKETRAKGTVSGAGGYGAPEAEPKLQAHLEEFAGRIFGREAKQETARTSAEAARAADLMRNPKKRARAINKIIEGK